MDKSDYSIAEKERRLALHRESNRQWKLRNPEKVRISAREWWAKKHPGRPAPTRPRPDLCECCGKPEGGNRRLALDHCHETEAFRGWLCWHCNTAIGRLGDTMAGLQRAMDYLKGANLSTLNKPNGRG